MKQIYVLFVATVVALLCAVIFSENKAIHASPVLTVPYSYNENYRQVGDVLYWDKVYVVTSASELRWYYLYAENDSKLRVPSPDPLRWPPQTKLSRDE